MENNLDLSGSKALTRLYRVAFCGISLFFFLLSAIVSKKTTNWSCSLVFANATLIKISISLLSFLFGLVSFSTAFLLSPEKEAISNIAKQAAKNLKKSFDKIKIEQRFHLLNLGAKRVESKKLAHSFSDALDLIHQRKMQLFVVIWNIKKRREFDSKGRQQLINRTLLNFREELNDLVKEFAQFSQTEALLKSPLRT